MNDDPRVDRLIRRLEGPLDRAATRAAEERVWRRLREGHPVRGSGGWWPAFAVALVVLLLLAGAAYQQTYRLEVASGGIPILYQERVASVDLFAGTGTATGTDLIRGKLEVRQGHFSAADPSRFRVVAIDDVRVAEAALPATIEIRYRERGSAVFGVLARVADLSEARRATGDVRHNVVAPFPPVSRGDVHVFEVWLYVDTSRGAIESQILTIEVRGAPEGERARLITSR